jgi:hypothetical protein
LEAPDFDWRFAVFRECYDGGAFVNIVFRDASHLPRIDPVALAA